jgi:ribose-phosphate pyrophosphokinase
MTIKIGNYDRNHFNRIGSASGQMAEKQIRIIATPAHTMIAEQVCQKLDVPLFPVRYEKMPNGLWKAELLATPSKAGLFIIHTANSGTINENMMQLYALITAISKLPVSERPSKVVASCLHFPYAREERKAEPREPISAAAIANLITTVHYPMATGISGKMLLRVDEKRVVDRVIVVNLHSAAIEGFFPVPVDHLDGKLLIESFIRQHATNLENIIITGPDAGRFKMALKIAEDLFGEEAMKHLINIAKIRGKKDAAGRSSVESMIVGSVENKVVFVVDDMIDTGGTIIKAVKALKAAGAKEVFVVTVHGILSGTAIERLMGNTDIARIGIVDTVYVPKEKWVSMKPKTSRLHLASLLKNVIERTFLEKSIIGYQSIT